MSNGAPERVSQTLEVQFKKVVHLRDYENEENGGTISVTYAQPLTTHEVATEMTKLQAELEYAIFHSLYMRRIATTNDYTKRIAEIIVNLLQLGVTDALDTFFTITFNGQLVPETTSKEIALRQAQGAVSVLKTLYTRSVIPGDAYKAKISEVIKQLTQFGVEDAVDYVKGLISEAVT